LVHKNGIKFENVYIYSKTLDQAKYVMLGKILSGVPSVKLFKFINNETVIQLEKALPNSVFLFDDVITENHGIIRSYFNRSRHNLIDVRYLAQWVPKQPIRDNENFIVLFMQDELNLKHIYDERCSGDIKYSEFKDFAWLAGREADSNALLSVAKMNAIMVGIGTVSISMSLYNNKAKHRN